jgi:hypothetical protein
MQRGVLAPDTTMVGAETKTGAQLVIASAEPLGGHDCLEAAREAHLAEVLKREAVAQAPEHDRGDDVGGILGLFSTPALRSLNCRPQSRQRKRQ